MQLCIYCLRNYTAQTLLFQPQKRALQDTCVVLGVSSEIQETGDKNRG